MGSFALYSRVYRFENFNSYSTSDLHVNFNRNIRVAFPAVATRQATDLPLVSTSPMLAPRSAATVVPRAPSTLPPVLVTHHSPLTTHHTHHLASRITPELPNYRQEQTCESIVNIPPYYRVCSTYYANFGTTIFGFPIPAAC